jgi:hypothetical protein
VVSTTNGAGAGVVDGAGLARAWISALYSMPPSGSVEVRALLLGSGSGSLFSGVKATPLAIHGCGRG